MRRSLLFRVSALAVVALVLAWMANARQLEPWEPGVWSSLNVLASLPFMAVMLPVLSLFSIGVLLFLVAPLFGERAKRWRTPTMRKLRWAFIGAMCAGIGFAVYKALEFTPYRPESSSFQEAFGLLLLDVLTPAWTIAFVGLASVSVGLWALRRWWPTVHREIEPERHDARLRWALIGALWIAICIAGDFAFDAWARYPILLELAPQVDPDGARPPHWMLEVFWPSLGLYVLPKLTIPVLVSALIAADWWFIGRRRTTPTGLSTV